MDSLGDRPGKSAEIAGELALRHAALRKEMQAAGIDLYLILGSPRNPMGVHYASNYDVIGDGALVAVPLEGEPTLYVAEEWDQARAASLSPIRDIRYSENLAKTAGTLLKQNRSAIAGVDAESAPFAAEIKASSGKDIAHDNGMINRAARRKTPYELSIIRYAAQLADAAFERGYEALTDGIREYEFLAEMEYSMRAGGAFDNFGFFSSGTHQHAIGVATNKPIVPGDYLIFEITPAVISRNYSAQLCKTMTLGPAGDGIKDKYKILAEAFAASRDHAKPGVTVGAITKVMDDVISKYGYADYCKPPYMRARGHGFGLGSVSLSQKSTQVLEPGMAMIIHPNQYFPETGYLALGEMVIMTETGAEPLSKLKHEIFEKL